MMTEGRLSRLEELVPLVREHLLPLIQESVDACVRTYAGDDYNDSYVFGSQLWRITWNRFLALAARNSSPFTHSGDSQDFGLRIGSAKIEHHPVRQDTRLPNNAKAIKKRLEVVQLDLFADAQEEESVWLPASAVLGIVASPEVGLIEVFLGVLQKKTFTSQYTWREEVTVYLASSLEEANQTVVTPTAATADKVLVEPEAEPDIRIELPLQEELPARRDEKAP